MNTKQFNLPYDNNLEETSEKRLSGKNISEWLKDWSMSKWDIFCYGKREYRYVGNGKFQSFVIGKVMWLHTNHLEWDLYNFIEGSFEKVYQKEIPHTIKIKWEPCIVIFKEDGSITWKNQYGTKGRFWNSKGISPMEWFRKSLKRKRKKSIVNEELSTQIDNTKHTLPAIIDTPYQTAEDIGEIPQGTFLAPNLVNPWEEELPDFPHIEDDHTTLGNNENPEKLVLLNIPGSLELHGINVSDISAHLLEIATRKAQERLDQERTQKNIFWKGVMFFTRKKRLETLIKEELDILEADGMFWSNTRTTREHASSRNESENILFQNISASTSIIIPEINTLATQFVHGEIDQKDFEQDFETIIQENDSCSSITDTGSNIVLELKGKREVYAAIMSDELVDFTDIFNTPDKKEFLENILWVENINDDIIQNIFTAFSPQMRKQLQDQTIEISLDIFTKTNNSAFSVQDNQKTGGTAYGIGKNLQKHSKKSAAIYVTAIWALSLLTAGAGIVAGIGVTALWAVWIWSKTGFRRYAEYTDSHNQAQDRITRWEETDLSEKKQWWVRKLFSWIMKSDQTLYGKTRDTQWENTTTNINSFIGTMHHHFMPIERLNARFEKILRGESLRSDKDTERNTENINAYLAQAVARLDMHHKTGHNFFRTTKKTITDRKWHMEQQMSELQKNVLRVSIQRWVELWDIIISDPEYDHENSQNTKTLRNSPVYLWIVEKLNADLEFANNRFDAVRRSTSIKTWAITGWVYALTSSLLWYLTQGTTTTTWPSTLSTAPSWTTTVLGWFNIDSNIATELQNVLWTTKYQAFINNIQSAQGSETLWDTLTKDIFHNNNLGNEAKNEIMNFILNASDVQAGITKPELLIEAENQGLFTDISSNSPRIDIVLERLSEWWYGNVNKTWLVDTISGINDGSITVSSLNPSEQTKISEALWCYVHRNAPLWAQPMFEVFMDRLPDIVTTHGGETIIIPGELETITKSGIWWVGIPTWRNTFLPENKAPVDKENDTDEQEVVKEKVAA